MFNLRKAAFEEYSAVKNIYGAPHANPFVFGRTEPEIAEVLLDRISVNDQPGISGLYVLEEKGKIVATANLTKGKYQTHHTLNIGGLVVQIDCQGRGIGKVLLSKIEELAVQSGIKKLQLEVEEDNAPAIGLYTKAGFKEEGRMVDFVEREEGGPCVDEIIMGKKIITPEK